MARVVGAVSMSHAPGLTASREAPPSDVRQRIDAALDDIGSMIERIAPTTILAFLDDHFDNHYRSLMPTFAVGVADVHRGPGEHYVEFLKIEPRDVRSDAHLAEVLLDALVTGDFDAARMGRIEYGNNLMCPLDRVMPGSDIPVVPVFINAFTPPVCTMRRAYDLGQKVRQIVESAWPGTVLFLGTGGLSHWPPIWNENSPPEDVFLQRMREFQTTGRAVLETDPNLYSDLGKYEEEMARTRPLLINETWDRGFIDAVTAGDVGFVTGLGYADIERDAGNGGHEVLNWAAVMGTMNGAPARCLAYEPVPEWICGMGFAVYEEGSNQIS
ncbi:MAG: extradiol dioxygenase [Actinomycetota bacterium]